MGISKNAWKTSVSILPAIGMLIAPQAVAQSDTITVTAQKREQNLQDVPMSVQAVTGEAITEKVVILLDQVDESVPNLTIVEGLTGNTLNIRGIGSGQGSVGFEQSVATFADGVYVGRSRQSRASLLDVQQIEVLRGPQPVFFGQSAVAGALNITTRDGKGDFEAGLTTSYGNDDEFVVEGGVTVPIIADSLGLRLAGRYSEYDGFSEDLTSTSDGSRESYALRGTLNFQVTDNFDIEVKGEFGRTEQNGTLVDVAPCDAGNPVPGPLSTTFCDAILPGGAWAGFLSDDLSRSSEIGVVANGGDLALVDTNGPAPGGLSTVPVTGDEFTPKPDITETTLIAGTWNYDLGPATLTGIHSYSEYEYSRTGDIDATPFALFSPSVFEGFEASSHEVRITSNESIGGFLDYMVGYYRQSHEIDAANETAVGLTALLGAPPPARNSNGSIFVEDSTWNSVFAAFTGHINDRARLNFGVRYSDVSKEGYSFLITTPTVFDGFGEFTIAADSPNYQAGPNAAAIAGLTITGLDSAADCPGGFQEANTGRGGATETHCVVGSVDTDDFSFQVSGEYDVNDDVMVYASFTTGFKAGGLAQSGQGIARSSEAFVFDDEDVKSYEIGLNSQLFDKRLRFNASAFYMDFENLQVTSFDVVDQSFNVQNAAEAETYGIEFDSDLSVNDQLSLSLSGAWIETELGSFPGAQCSQFEQGNNLNGCTFGVPMMSPPVSTTDRAGEDLLYAPTFQINFGARYEVDLSEYLRGGLSGNIIYQDDYIVSDRYDPRTSTSDSVGGGIQEGYERLNLRAEVGAQDGRWTLAAYANNVTDQQPLVNYGPTQFNGIDGGFAVIERGRSYGVQLRLNTN